MTSVNNWDHLCLTIFEKKKKEFHNSYYSALIFAASGWENQAVNRFYGLYSIDSMTLRQAHVPIMVSVDGHIKN